ncbi:hypothetical protein [Variovorax sp. N23]|uniref:hypothetical protein n=1 Tax=Variovorax sp. N23 TaxID=2980555 RepID=UPI0021C75E39|nr:hypothetical protein [Variovorax sp. N23]MCU4120156.1 hypothetical protein [Variovorax sp. N23]
MTSPTLRFAACLLLTVASAAQAQTQTPARKPLTKQPAKSAPAAPVEKAVLRVGCEGDSAGAEVSVNGEIKGQCPLDMQIPVGVVRIWAAKPAGPDRERVFEKEMRLGTGVVQRVDIVVGWYQTTAEAIKRWERAANAGDAQSMYQLGWAYEWGTAGVVDFAKASAWYGRAAEAGNAAAMEAYGAAIVRGSAAEKSPEVAKAWFAKALAKGDGAALAYQAMHYKYSKDPREVAQSPALYARAAQAGQWGALNELLDSEPDPDKKLSLRRQINQIQLTLAEAGSALEMQIISSRYARGESGLPKDTAKENALSQRMFTYAEKAAATGDAEWLKKLADYYRFGSDWNPKDKVMAEKLYREALAKGEPDAQRGLDMLMKE